ncbi:tetratricopeptide repeat protein, partial [Tyzzerella sp. OttesenSCG-928-J15]|nr:tetratricopeptide repeat protein [Tyzzerella sp. OttesenSCG-928-J15]
MNYTNLLKLKNKFNTLSTKKEFMEAAKIGDMLIDEYFKCNMTNSKKYADDIFDIACVNDEWGNISRAEELYKESGRIYKRICGKDVGYTYRINNLAVLYSKTGRKEEALQLYK